MKAKGKHKVILPERTQTGFLARVQAFFARPRVSAATFYFLAFAIPTLMLHLVYVLLSREEFLPNLSV